MDRICRILYTGSFSEEMKCTKNSSVILNLIAVLKKRIHVCLVKKFHAKYFGNGFHLARNFRILLAEICMTYGYIYVAQIALGANMAQAVKVIAEAEAYPGPSLIIGYAPCELHGVKGGMTNCQNEMKKAVEAGYWNLFTFNPANKAQGKNPFTLTSKAVDNEKYQALLANETRYSRLTRAFPDRAKELFARNQEVANDRYEHLTRLVELYK